MAYEVERFGFNVCASFYKGTTWGSMLLSLRKTSLVVMFATIQCRSF